MVQFGQFLGHGKSETSTRIGGIRPGRNLKKAIENKLNFIRRDADPCILYADGESGLIFKAQFYGDGTSCRGEF